ncbi:hypothetical protein AQUCO_05700154v1 [Aquilegia coerulea]|uniref:Mitochondrial Rho GTPase n=1 Tax=Aquilegia coerulea TaxID=218851 RepID=A0A2G5CG63_AQUCA|nr:hypothetical protein AQUCO_05700154v1 [Aquilegia coerulea]PIA30249.1 hypothetical protein AQUCO_05700154v1 [Aquilegia coerulea]
MGIFSGKAKSSSSSISGNKSKVRIVVAGDCGTGKSSLIATAASEKFAQHVPPVLTPTRLFADFYPDRIPFTVNDTPSSSENQNALTHELETADAVVLTYSCDQPHTLDRLSTFWLPELRRLQVKVPVVVVGCKLDAVDDTTVRQEQLLSLVQEFEEIETCTECSARNLFQVSKVFYYANVAVLFPTSPLFDKKKQTLKPKFERALKRIFILCDHDRDNTLSDTEFNDLQIKCFNVPLPPSEVVDIKRVVQEKYPEGVNERGLTLRGFLILSELLLQKGSHELWTVLRKFGYDNDIKLRDDLLHVSFKRAPDQSVELTNEAVKFLKEIFCSFDHDSDGALQVAELDDLFSTAPESPWIEPPYKDAAESTATGGISLDGFLSKWSLMTLLEPNKSLANLIYIGYVGDPASAFDITKARRLNSTKKQSERKVLQSFVFGPNGAGKSALLNSFLRRPFPEVYTPTTNERFAANVVYQDGGTKKILILREIPEDGARQLVCSKESLGPCDVAVFVHDISNEQSWKRATELLVEVASHGEESGFEVPCLIVAAKDDLNMYPLAIQDSTRVSFEMGLETAIPLSVKLGDLNDVFCRIVSAAQKPHLGIPKLEYGRNYKRYYQIFRRPIKFISVGAAVAVVGLAASHVYTARKITSS